MVPQTTDEVPNTDAWGNEVGRSERDERGAFVRLDSLFRGWVRADPQSEYPAQPGRYHLYVAMGCPWANRAVMVHALKGLEGVVGLSVVAPVRDERGWAFTGADGTDLDPIHGWKFLSEGYEISQPGYARRVSVPVLWDTDRGRIVNNESSEIIVMLNDAFDEWAAHPEVDLYPEALRPEIDAINEWVYSDVNNGVYRCGFATSQEAYDKAVVPLFEALDHLDSMLAERRYLVGPTATLADWRLFSTLVRFDLCYHGVFKCNRRRITDYEHLWPYTRDLYQTPGIAATINFEHIVRGYWTSIKQINPSGIIPIGPDLDFLEPHRRERLG